MRTESPLRKLLVLVLAGLVLFFLVRNQIRITDDEDDRSTIITFEDPSPIRQADYRETQK